MTPGRPPKQTEKRLKPIRARLAEGYSEDDLRTVCNRVAESKGHLGENDRGKAYIEPQKIFGSTEGVDGWLATKPAAVVRVEQMHPEDRALAELFG